MFNQRLKTHCVRIKPKGSIKILHGNRDMVDSCNHKAISPRTIGFFTPVMELILPGLPESVSLASIANARASLEFAKELSNRFTLSSGSKS